MVKRATCCGQPAFNAGFVTDARRAATPTLRALAKTTGPIVVPSGSCAAMIKHRWPDMFASTKHRVAAHAVSARVIELSQALAADADRDARDQSSEGAAPAPDRPTSDRPTVAWHGSCHATRELGVTNEPNALLAATGCGVIEPADADQCCGFGGTFSVKFADVSVAMADAKLDALCATGCDTVVGGDLSCLVHLQARAEARELPLRFDHLAERLDAVGPERATRP